MHKTFKAVYFVLFLLVLLFHSNGISYAIEDPLSLPNNKFGIHILFPSELETAAQLVNSNGGDWGYVTIPIQAVDKDLLKWQKFMDEAKRLHVIPILRIATEGDYFDTKSWRKPAFEDVLDFANFLDSLVWPTKNRYVIIFNEVNRSDEWGEAPSPLEYAQRLSYAVTVFKSKNQDFFILPAGLDNAAPTVTGVSMNEYEFMRQMNEGVPGIFYQVDGFTSHSYPNPGFSQTPEKQDQQSIASFRHETALISTLSTKKLPVFITETGWSKDFVSEFLQSTYYRIAFTSVWTDPLVVAVTPFLLRADIGPFTVFSLIKENASPSAQLLELLGMKKQQGMPSLAINLSLVTGSSSQNILGTNQNTKSELDFSQSQIQEEKTFSLTESIKAFIKWLLKIV